MLKHHYFTLINYDVNLREFTLYLVHSILIDTALASIHETTIFRSTENVIKLCEEQAQGDNFLLIALPNISVDTFLSAYENKVNSFLTPINELHYSTVNISKELILQLSGICESYISSITALSGLSDETITRMCEFAVHDVIGTFPLIELTDIKGYSE